MSKFTGDLSNRKGSTINTVNTNNYKIIDNFSSDSDSDSFLDLNLNPDLDLDLDPDPDKTTLVRSKKSS